MTLNMAILGAGRIGQVHSHAVAFSDGCRLVAIADPSAQAAAAISTKYGCAVRSIDEIAASPDVDAVIICTPTDLHAAQIEQFARAGKAIFCEKPIDLSLDRVRQCLKTVDDHKATLMLGFNRRFDPDFMAVKAAVEAGEVGDVEMITIISRDPSAPPADYIKRSGGIFRDMTIHDFDMARWLLGEEVETVFAQGSALTDPAIKQLGDFDSANIILTTQSGRQVVISNSRRATYGYDQRIEVLGSLGMVAADNRTKTNTFVANANGFASPTLLDFFMVRYAQAYKNEIAAFAAAIADGATTPVNGHDGMMALAIAEAAALSASHGRAVNLTEILT